jgi:FtsH-binding integral membrane protein
LLTSFVVIYLSNHHYHHYQVCYDTRNVPDAINESPAIAKVILIVSAIAVVIFVVVFVSELDPWANELLTGVGFFAAYAALMGYYFFPKVNLYA